METFSLVSAFLAMTCWGLGDFLAQRSVRKIGSLETLAWISLIGGVMLLPLILRDLPLLLVWDNMQIMLVLSLLTGLTSWLMFKALSEGKLSVVEIILTVELPLTIFLGMLFFKEDISPLQATLVTLLLLGVILVSKNSPSYWQRIVNFLTGRSSLLERGILIGIAAAAVSSSVNFMTALGSKQVTPIMAIWFPCLICAAVSLLFLGQRNKLKSFIRHKPRHMGMILATGIVNTAAWIFFALAVTDNELSVTAAITESYPVVAMLLGIKYNGEKITGYQVLGGALAISASILMGFLS